MIDKHTFTYIQGDNIDFVHTYVYSLLKDDWLQLKKEKQSK